MDCAAVEAGSTAIETSRDTRGRRGCAGWRECLIESHTVPSSANQADGMRTSLSENRETAPAAGLKARCQAKKSSLCCSKSDQAAIPAKPKSLIRRSQTKLMLSGRPLGECRLKLNVFRAIFAGNLLLVATQIGPDHADRLNISVYDGLYGYSPNFRSLICLTRRVERASFHKGIEVVAEFRTSC